MAKHARHRKGVSEEKKTMIKDAFNLFDSDSDGYLDYLELKSALRALGFPVKKVEINKILDTYDKINGKLISLDDFYSVAVDKMTRRDPIQEIQFAFRLFLEGNSSSISCGDLQRVVNMLGIDISPEEIQGMVHEFDLDGDGRSSHVNTSCHRG